MATDQQLDIRVHGAQQTQSPVHGGLQPPHGGKGGAGIGPIHGLNGNGGVVAALATWNAADMAATGMALSNGGLTATTSGAADGLHQAGVRATKAIAGKVYWEVTVDLLVDGWAAGVANALASLAGGAYWGNGGNANLYAPFGAGSVTYMFAADKPNNLIWRGIAGTNTWTGDPVAGTGGTSIAGITGAIYPAFQGDAGDKATANFGQTAYIGTKPVGYSNV